MVRKNRPFCHLWSCRRKTNYIKILEKVLKCRCIPFSYAVLFYAVHENQTPTNLSYNKFHSIMLYNHIWKQKSHGNLWGRGLLANKARTKLYATYLLLQPPLRLPLLLTSHATSNRMRTQDEIFALKETKNLILLT